MQKKNRSTACAAISHSGLNENSRLSRSQPGDAWCFSESNFVSILCKTTNMPRSRSSCEELLTVGGKPGCEKAVIVWSDGNFSPFSLSLELSVFRCSSLALSALAEESPADVLFNRDLFTRIILTRCLQRNRRNCAENWNQKENVFYHASNVAKFFSKNSIELKNLVLKLISLTINCFNECPYYNALKSSIVRFEQSLTQLGKRGSVWYRYMAIMNIMVDIINVTIVNSI